MGPGQGILLLPRNFLPRETYGMTREKLCQLGRSKVNLTSPEEKIKLNQCLPRNPKIIPSLRLPRNKIKLYHHLPRNKIIPSLILPRNKTKLNQHLPSIKTIPSQLLPRNITIP